MPKQIPLTQGKVAIVDDKDFEYLNQWKWYAWTNRSTWYAVRTDQSGCRIYMHRLVEEPHSDLEVDHRNGDGLDNRRENLRSCTSRQNKMNSRKRLGCTSRFKGVSWNRQRKIWHVRISFSGKEHYIGRFDDELAAAAAYNKVALEYFGEFSRLNIIEVLEE